TPTASRRWLSTSCR
ncbi:hypothetical protein AB1N83_014076, partial [Pleurotus pulmonarius]